MAKNGLWHVQGVKRVMPSDEKRNGVIVTVLRVKEKRTSMNRKRITKSRVSGFTMVEIIVVMVILIIAAMLAVPMVSSAADMQLQTAANVITADLEYAKNLAITRQESYSVVFSPGTSSYEIHDSSGVIAHPQLSGRNFVVSFADEKRLNRVSIAIAEFDAVQTISFDYLGSPYSGVGTATPMNSGVVTLQADTNTTIVNIEPVTGYITTQ